jgi:hypothetical protein
LTKFLVMIQAASVTGFVKTIVIILLVWYGMKILSRLFAPFLVRYVAKKAEQKFGGGYSRSQNEKSKSKEGETSIDKMPRKNAKYKKNVGEYVDYEEID